METLTVRLWIDTLEPGRHISRETIARRLVGDVALPLADCKEARPDWGEYFPLVTFDAIWRALRRGGHVPPLASDAERYRYGVVE